MKGDPPEPSQKVSTPVNPGFWQLGSLKLGIWSIYSSKNTANSKSFILCQLWSSPHPSKVRDMAISSQMWSSTTLGIQKSHFLHIRLFQSWYLEFLGQGCHYPSVCAVQIYNLWFIHALYPRVVSKQTNKSNKSSERMSHQIWWLKSWLYTSQMLKKVTHEWLVTHDCESFTK